MQKDRRDIGWSNATRGVGHDLDPVTQMLVRRTLQVRRAARKNKEVKEPMMKNLKKYVEEVGT